MAKNHGQRCKCLIRKEKRVFEIGEKSPGDGELSPVGPKIHRRVVLVAFGSEHEFGSIGFFVSVRIEGIVIDSEKCLERIR
jgi:hypothetical protein